MKKFTAFRSFGSANENIDKHELVCVEYGKDIDDVTDDLLRQLSDDILGLPKYQTGFTSYGYAPEETSYSGQQNRYAYIMDVVASPSTGEKNEIIEYGIKEEDADDCC